MKISIIGRTEMMFETALLLHEQGHEIVHIITAKEAPEYTKTLADFQEMAKEWDIPCIHSAQIGEEILKINQAQPDIGVSVNYPGIIPQSVIDCYPHGILNAHGGDLPRYRGNACQAWAIINGEERIGLCIHKMVEKLDGGDIIARDYLPINHATKVTCCLEWMAERIPKLFLEAINKLEGNPEYILERQSINPEDALRCYPRRPEDGRIDWSKSSLEILRLINATNKPHAGAFCKFKGEKMIIWDAELVKSQKNFCAIPGQVTRIGEGFIEIACGEGKLMVKDVEFKTEVGTPDLWIQSIRKRLT